MRKAFIFLFFLTYIPVFAQTCRVDITMSPDNLKTLFTRRLFKKDFLQGTISVDGTNYGACKLKFKGSTSPLFPKKPFRVKLEKGSAVPPAFNGNRKMNLNAMYTDKSFIRERIVWDIFQMMGGFGPKQYGYAEFNLNGCYNGLYLLLEHVDEDFLKENGKPEGSVYEAEEEVSSGNLRPIAESMYEQTYEKHVGDEKDYSDLKSLITRLNNTSDNDIAAVLNEEFDMKTVYDWFILNVLTMSGDSYVKNYYLYRDPTKAAQKWSIIPWDYDLSFGRDGDDKIVYPNSILNDLFAYVFEPLAGPDNLLKEKVMKDPVLFAEFKKRLYEVLQNIFTEERLYPLIDKYSAEAEPFVSKETLRWGSENDFRDQVDAIKYYVAARRNFLLSFYGYTNSSENDEVSVNVTETGTMYNFVDHDGKMVAQMTFSSISGPMTVHVRAYPNSVQAGLNSSMCVHRKLEVETEPPSARFNAVLRWEYLHANDFNELGDGVADGNGMFCYQLSGGTWQKLDSYVNAYGDYVTVLGVNESNCGTGKFFAISLPEGFSPVFSKEKNLFWNRWHDIRFANGQTGYVAGDDGSVLVTNDGAASWRLLFTGNHAGLNTIALTGNNIITGGMYGVLFKSTSGGNSWESVKSGTNSTINRIEFVSGTGLAVCNGGYVLRSENSGSSWSPKMVNGAKDLYALCMVNENTVVIGGDGGMLFVSNDRGESWRSSSSGFSNAIRSITSHDQRITAVCDGGMILTSGNSGESWQPVSSQTTENLLSVCWTNQGWMAGGENGTVQLSSNGTEWRRLDNLYPNDIMAIAYGESVGTVAVGNFGAIFRTR